ncbi:MAG: hypothetical protein ACHQWU_00800 [Gemmatimonadales bacterium]|jgi:hypothetical protein
MTSLNRLLAPVIWFAAIASIATSTACDKHAENPQLQLTDIGFALTLPPAMQHALDSLAPGFRAISSTSYRSDIAQAAAAGGGIPALFATVGDFDHNGTVDVVEEGTLPADSALHVIAILNGAKPTAVEVARIESYDADALGLYLSLPAAGQSGAFELVSYPDSSTLFEYADGAFQGHKVGS